MEQEEVMMPEIHEDEIKKSKGIPFLLGAVFVAIVVFLLKWGITLS